MNLLDKFERIQTLALDVDGVLTNGQVTLMPNGEVVRHMNIKDSYAIQYAIKQGLNIIVITGGSSEVVKEKLQFLGIKDVFLRSYNKLEVMQDYMLENEITWEEIAYVGDDLPDFEVMKRVLLPCSPKDAAREIKDISLFISSLNGGDGCVREIIEKILLSQNKWGTGDLTW